MVKQKQGEKKGMNWVFLLALIVVGLGLVIFLLDFDPLAGAEVSYDGSRPDIPIEIYINTSLSLEAQLIDIHAQKEAGAIGYGCPEQGGYVYSSLTRPEVVETSSYYVLERVRMDCNSGKDYQLFFKIISGPSPDAGVSGEYDYLQKSACTDKGGLKEVGLQSLVQDDEGNTFDLIQVECNNGETENHKFPVNLGWAYEEEKL